MKGGSYLKVFIILLSLGLFVFFVVIISNPYFLWTEPEYGDGVHYQLNTEETAISNLYLIKDGKPGLKSYNFYANGMIQCVEDNQDSARKSNIYDDKGRLLCYRLYDFKKANNNDFKNFYYYYTIDSSCTLEFVENDAGRLLKVLMCGKKKYIINSDKQIVVHPGNYMLSRENDSLYLYGFTDDYQQTTLGVYKIEE